LALLDTLIVAVAADTRALTAGLGQASSSVRGFGTQVGGLGKTSGAAFGAVAATAAVGGIALAAFAADSIRAATAYDEAFTRIGAISNSSAEDIERWKGEVMDLSGETAKAPQELAEALFFLSSAGLESSEVMGTLEMSAKASAVGLGSVTDVANITASAMNAYADAGLTAAEVTDTLVAAVREGRAEPEEFAGALGRILPIAAATGVTFDQVTASLAALSNIGLDVNEGVTAMRGVLQAIAAPGTQAANAMADLGLSAQDLLDAISQRGLFGALQLLDKAAQRNTQGSAAYNDVLRKIIPNVRALTGVLGLTGQEAAKVDMIFNNVADSGGSLAEAFGKTTQSDAFKLSQALTALRNAGQKVAATVLPVLARNLAAIGEVVAVLVGGALLYKLATGFRALTAAIAANPIGLVLTAAATAYLLLNDAQAKSAASLEALTGSWSSGATSLEMYALQVKLVADATGAWDVQGFRETIAALHQQYLDGAISLEEYTRATDYLRSVLGQSAEETARLFAEQQRYERVTATESARLTGLAGQYALVGDAVTDLGNKTGELTRKQERLAESLEDLLGQYPVLTSQVGDFATELSKTPAEYVKNANAGVTWARRVSGAIDELLKSDLPKRMKNLIGRAGEEAVVAWARMTEGQREEFERSLKLIDTLRADISAKLSKLAKTLYAKGAEAGGQFDSGLAAGIRAKMPWVISAARDVAIAAVDAAKDELKAASPSKVMFEVGEDVVQGLINGMESKNEDAQRAAAKTARELSKALERGLAQLEKDMEKALAPIERRLEQVQSRADDLRSAIVGSFGDFLDLSGAAGAFPALVAAQEALAQAQAAGGVEAIAQAQEALAQAQAAVQQVTSGQFMTDLLSQAQQWSAILRALGAQGAGPALLGQIAGLGPEAIPFAQALLQMGPEQLAALNAQYQAIADLQNQVADNLTNAFFGEKIDNLRDELRTIREDFRERMHSIQEVLNRIAKALENVTALQGGGLVTRPTLAVVGEGGPELVIPAGRGLMAGGGARPTINVTVNGWVGNDQQIAARVRDELVKLQRRNSNTTGIR